MNDDEFELPMLPPMPMWSVRWLAMGPLFGWAIGAQAAWLLWGGWWSLVAVIFFVGGVVGLVWWAKWMTRANLIATMSFTIANRLCGPVAQHGATVTIYPAGEGIGMVEVVLPPKEESNGH